MLNTAQRQRESAPACVVCGARAGLFCARCVVTPYCSELCQRKDWGRRHSAVCHNLLRLDSARSGGDSSPAPAPLDLVAVNNAPVPEAPAPLRRPRVPVAGRSAPQRNGLPNGNKDFKISGEKPRNTAQPTHYSNNNKTKFVPPGHHPSPQRRPGAAPAQQNEDDEEWGATDKKATEPKAAQKSRPGICDITNPPKPSLDRPKPSLDPPKPSLNPPQLRFEKPQPKVVSPEPQVTTPNPKVDVTPNTRMTPKQETKVDVKPRTLPAALVPSQFLVEKLPIGESFVLSVEQPAGACASKQAGFVCLAMHADYQTQFNDLLGDICHGDGHIVPSPGATFAYFEPSDEGWYRARCLSATRCALLDASRVADITARTPCRALASQYNDIPEFCCVLDGKAEVNMSLKCTILMKTSEGYKVSIDSATEDSYLGEGLVTRWLPEVEPPPSAQPAPVSIQNRLKQERVEPVTPEKNPEAKPQAIPDKKPQVIPDKSQAIPDKSQAIPDKPQVVVEKAEKPAVPDIPRPDVINNGRYVLLHVTSLARACVRACDDVTTAEFESVLQDAALYGIQSAKRLTTPPTPGEVVLCHYEGVHYRALVTRTKAAENRYKVQYAEYGNEEIVSLEKLYVCPRELNLNSRPARASILALSTTQCQLTPPATEYIDSLKEEVELIAKIPTGQQAAPSGSLVTLSLAQNKENVTRKLEEMCTPDWKKLEDAGGDVVESDVILFSSMRTVPLPTDRPFVLEVTDFTYLERGMVCGFESGIKLPQHVYGPLTDRINEYCNSALCSEPYLPMVEELCLAKLEPYPQWFRAVVVSHRPGEPTATVLYVDYGNLCASVPVADLRKCMPEFARDPALAASADIKDWPKPVTQEHLLRSVEYLQLDEEGRGRLPVAACRLVEDDMSYVIEVPELIAAITK